MTHILEAGLEFMENQNPHDLPKVRGYNIISTREDVHDAIAAAREALASWSSTPAPTRGQIIGNMGRLLMEHKEDLVRLQAREIGKTVKECGGEIQEAIDTCLFFQSEGRRLY